MTRYQVYVLKNPSGRFYIGLSENILRRLEQHNTGLSRWTKNKGPWEIFWESPFMSLSEARKLENKLKRQKGGAGLMTLLHSGS